MLNQMRGRGLTLSTDFNGFNSTSMPRFGGGNPGSSPCAAGTRDYLTSKWPDNMPKWRDLMPELQKLGQSGIWYDDYDVGSTASDLGKPVSVPGMPTDGGAAWVGSNSRYRRVVARNVNSIREDNAPRYKMEDVVYYNNHGPDLEPHHWDDQVGNRPGAQLSPLKRWRNFHAGWDYNLDGFQHIGMLPDLLQDMRNVGVQWEQMGPLFNGASDMIGTWRRSVAIGTAHP
jgi:hypothetical protein